MFFAATTGVELSDCTQTVSEHFIEPDLQIHRIDGGTRAALILGTLELFFMSTKRNRNPSKSRARKR
jgi:hypothetical protein